MSDDTKGIGKYVYCIIRSNGEKRSFGNIGFDGGEVYTMDYRDYSPVVSDAPVKEYDVCEKDVELQKKVIEYVMKEHSVLPMAYGMVFKNKKLLMIAMSAGYKAMRKAFGEVDNKVELGIKLLLPKDAGMDGKEKCKSDYIEALKKVSVQTKELKLFSDRLLLNASFLVEKDAVDLFSNEVNLLGNKYSNIKVQYSGPWPPYNFVDIHILSKNRGGFR